LSRRLTHFAATLHPAPAETITARTGEVRLRGQGDEVRFVPLSRHAPELVSGGLDERGRHPGPSGRGSNGPLTVSGITHSAEARSGPAGSPPGPMPLTGGRRSPASLTCRSHQAGTSATSSATTVSPGSTTSFLVSPVSPPVLVCPRPAATVIAQPSHCLMRRVFALAYS
jgi:hypothetical protein